MRYLALLLVLFVPVPLDGQEAEDEIAVMKSALAEVRMQMSGVPPGPFVLHPYYLRALRWGAVHAEDPEPVPPDALSALEPVKWMDMDDAVECPGPTAESCYLGGGEDAVAAVAVGFAQPTFPTDSTATVTIKMRYRVDLERRNAEMLTVRVFLLRSGGQWTATEVEGLQIT